jgi:hypothetical protein
MSEFKLRVSPEKVPAIEACSDKVTEALADVPPNDQLFVLAMVATAVIQQAFPDPEDSNSAFEDFINIIWHQLNDEGPPKVQ